MKYVVTADEMKEYDNNTITQIGIPAIVLMERAALAVQNVVMEVSKAPARVLIIAGVGNNGADGLALARLLSEREYQVDVFVYGDLLRASDLHRQQMKILEYYPVNIYHGEQLLSMIGKIADADATRYGVVVDAMFGIGLTRELSAEANRIFRKLSKLKAKKIAMDIPSGVCADTGKLLGDVLSFDITVTFGFPKRGLYLYPGAAFAGEVRVADIGITSKAFFEKKPTVYTLTEAEASQWKPYRRGDGNKGHFGKVLVIAGFEYMAGAAIMCAKAALESGAGMVKVLCPKENREIVQSAIPEILYGTCEDLENSLKWADVVAIGPGLGKGELALQMLQQVLNESELPLIVDADALNLISEKDGLKEALKCYPESVVMTPHIGELSRLSKECVEYLKENIFIVAKKLAEEYHCVMVCKDARTVVAAPGRETYLNLTGNHGMATAGSGDVLTGMVAAMMAQEGRGYESAVGAVFYHGLAGDLAAKKHSEYAVTATKIIENIGESLK